MKTYRINEIFYSIQGEGGNAGRAACFVRFSGCNLECRVEPGERSPGGFDCDTEFVSGRNMTGDEIVEYVATLCPISSLVIFTGGEPLLQLDDALIERFDVGSYELAIESNGTQPITSEMRSRRVYVCISPKVAEHALNQDLLDWAIDELRYVRGHGQGIPKPRIRAKSHFISPAFDGNEPDPKAIEWCCKLVKENPKWRLSIQTHKILKIR